MASPDMKALLHELSPIDSSEPELMDPLAVDSMRIFDTVVAAYLLDSDRSEFDEAYLADTYLQMRCLRCAVRRVLARMLLRPPLARRP